MSNLTLSWGDFWTFFKGCPDLSKKQMWSELLPNLMGIMSNSTPKIQKEVFEFAPDEVKNYLGYNKKVSLSLSIEDRIKLLGL